MYCIRVNWSCTNFLLYEKIIDCIHYNPISISLFIIYNLTKLAYLILCERQKGSMTKRKGNNERFL